MSSEENRSLVPISDPAEPQELQTPRQPSRWQILLEFAVIILVYASVQFHDLWIKFKLGETPISLGNLQTSPPAIALIALLLLSYHGGLRSIDFSWPKQWKRYFVQLAVLLVAFMLLESLLDNIIKLATDAEADQSNLLNSFKIPKVALFFLLVLFPVFAVGEELFYRAYLIQRFELLIGSRRFSTLTAVLLSSVIFALDHLQYGGGGIPGFIVSGLLFACIYLYTKRNLWIVSIIHYLSNSYAVFFILWSNRS